MILKELKAAWALLIGVGFIMLANGLQGTLLGLRATMEGFSTVITGVMMSGYFVGLMAGSLLAPKLVQRVGHVRVFGALASLASISILVHALFVNPLTWTLMRVVTGLAFAGLYVVSESWLNDKADNETRGKLLAMYMVVSYGSIGAGQFLLNVSDPGGMNLFVLTSVIVSFGLIPMLLTARPAPAFELTGKMSFRELFRQSPVAIISNVLTGVAHGTIFGLGAVYAQQSGYSVKQLSYFMAAYLVGAILFQWPIGHWSDRIDRRKVLLLMSLIAATLAIVAVFFPLASGGVWFYVIIVLLGGSALPMYSLCVAYANDRLEPEQMVAASGGLVLSAGIGLSAGPNITSWMMSAYGPNAYFFSIAGTFLIIACFIAFRMGKRAAVNVEEQTPYKISGPIGTPLTETLMPEDEINPNDEDSVTFEVLAELRSR